MFLFKKSLNPNGNRQLREVLLADSTAFTIGDAVKFNGTTAGLILWGAGGAGAGIIVDFKTASGAPLTDNGAGSDFVDTYTTPSSNTVVAVIDVSTESMYSCPADATLGTTTGSDVEGVNIDCVAASDTLDENTVAAGTASFHSWGVDPDNSSNLLVTIQESQVKL